jgi:hypothetical protein
LIAISFFAIASVVASAAALPPSTWVALAPVPGAGHLPVFALTVNPTNDTSLIAGNGAGALYRSLDGGASWTRVHSGRAAITAVAYSPFNPGFVIAGTRSGALVSTDAGVHWAATTGMDGRIVRVFGFARSLVVAGTDHGVYTSADGSAWTASGLSDVSISSIAVAAVNPPVRVLAGGDSGGQRGLPLFQSLDAATTWSPMKAAVSGTIVTALAAGPLPPKSPVRPLLLGTNTGLFISGDGGSTFTALSGGLLLPSTDYTQLGFTAGHFDRFYVASDGGGAGSGGLWATGDSGKHFSSLRPPLSSVTSLAVSSDELPLLYVATFRASDHTPVLWAYHDTGGTPQPPAGSNATPATAARLDSSGGSLLDLLKAVLSSQAPYVALGVGAVVVIVLAAISQFRSRRS